MQSMTDWVPLTCESAHAAESQHNCPSTVTVPSMCTLEYLDILRVLHAFRLRLNAILEAVTALTISKRQRNALAKRLSV